VNRVKNREWYRPFAAVILEEHFDKYFETIGVKKSESMTMSFQVKSDKIPGVTHADGSCRVQTISSGFLYDLLKVFYERTGCPVLLNTSMNSAGEPLIQTKQEALNMLENSCLDYIYFVDDSALKTTISENLVLNNGK